MMARKRYLWVLTLSGVSFACLICAYCFSQLEQSSERQRCSEASTIPPRARSITVLSTSVPALLRVKIPGHVDYQPSEIATIEATGPYDAVQSVRFQNDTLLWNGGCSTAADLIVHVRGPAVSDWIVDGPAQLDLKDLQQQDLRITINGAATASATGSVISAQIKLRGSGTADISHLHAEALSVKIAGEGQILTAPGEINTVLKRPRNARGATTALTTPSANGVARPSPIPSAPDN